MENKDCLEILNKAWSGRKDAPDYPDFDDINMALYYLKKNIKALEEENQMLEERKDYFFNRMCAFKIIIDILKEGLGLYLENKKFGKRIVYALMSKTLGMCLLNPTKKQYELLEEVFDYD